jgi:hypothetical protein
VLLPATPDEIKRQAPGAMSCIESDFNDLDGNGGMVLLATLQLSHATFRRFLMKHYERSTIVALSSRLDDTASHVTFASNYW